MRGEPLEWKRIARPTYKALLSYATSETEGEGLDGEGKPLLPHGKQKMYTALLKRVDAFDRLVELRHRTIIGHDFEGVSEALLLEHYTGRPVEGLKEVMGMLHIDVRDDPYQAVAEFVIQNLREG